MKRKYDGRFGNIRGIICSEVGYPATILLDNDKIITTSNVEKVYRTGFGGYIYIETKNSIYEFGKLTNSEINKPFRFFVKALEPVIVGQRARILTDDGWTLITSKVIRISNEHFETENTVYQFDRQRMYYPAS